MENEQKTAGKIKKRAEELFEQIREDRRYLHQIPEIGTDVPQTTAYICRRLDDMGIPWQSCGGPLSGKMTEDYISAGFPRMERATGVTAVIGKGAPCILLRADIDALLSGKKMIWTSARKADTATCAAMTVMRPCCWELHRS